jgi:hypothetical protein
MNDEFKPGTMGCHEAMHMAGFLKNAVMEQLVCHPAIERDPIWYATAQEAFNALADLYQAIGSVHLSDEDGA